MTFRLREICTCTERQNKREPYTPCTGIFKKNRNGSFKYNFCCNKEVLMLLDINSCIKL